MGWSKPALYAGCLWGAFFSFIGLETLVVQILRPSTHLDGWTIVFREQSANGGAIESREPLWFVLYFGFGLALFSAVGLLGARWLESRHRSLWFFGCVLCAFPLFFYGMTAGFLIYGLPLVIFAVLALTRRSRGVSGTALPSTFE